MPLDRNTLTALLYEPEGPALDFKQQQYPFAGASDEEKAELLKDILAFVNAWRRTDAFILIGVAERVPAPSEIFGVATHLRDNDLQQFVNSKVNQPIEFAYTVCEIDGRSIGVIQIPVQDRPRYLKAPFGRLASDTVFVRRGSSTDIAKPDEVARMGRAPLHHDHSPQLTVHFGDAERRLVLGSPMQITSESLDIGDLQDLPSYARPQQTMHGLNIDLDAIAGVHTNSSYYRELAEYTLASHFFTAVGLAITNASSVVATDVRVEMLIKSDTAQFLDESAFPDLPEPTWSMHRMSVVTEQSRQDVHVRRVAAGDLITARIPKVQPNSTAWPDSVFFVGGRESGNFTLGCTIFADNLPKPEITSLEINCAAHSRKIDLDGLLEIERDRWLASSEGRRVVREAEREKARAKGRERG